MNSVQLRGHLETHNLNVVNVYEITTKIGREFQLLMDRFGKDTLAALMSQVIQALEQLESTVLQHENDEKELMELKSVVERLELEKSFIDLERKKYEGEVEELEENWRDESKHLQEVVSSLKSENSRLKETLQHKPREPESHQQDEQSTKIEIELLTNLKQMIDHQRSEIRQLKKTLSQSAIDFDAMQQQVTKLGKLNVTLRQRHAFARKQCERLVEEKSELECQLQAKEKEMQTLKLKQQQSQIQNRNSDLQDFTDGVVKVELPSKAASHAVQQEKPVKVSAPILNSSAEQTMTEFEFMTQLRKQGKLIIDSNDPDRPRFTLQELRKVLLERNELKCQLIEAEEHLCLYRQGGDPDAVIQPPIIIESEKPSSKHNEHRDSGIRRLFSKVFLAPPKSHRLSGETRRPRGFSDALLSSGRSSSASTSKSDLSSEIHRSQNTSSASATPAGSYS